MLLRGLDCQGIKTEIRILEIDSDANTAIEALSEHTIMGLLPLLNPFYIVLSDISDHLGHFIVPYWREWYYCGNTHWLFYRFLLDSLKY